MLGHIADRDKLKRCVRHALCWQCGEKLGRYATFVVGPMCAINRTSGEPPLHASCARYAATACPFLTLPASQRREGGLPADCKPFGGVMIKRNPGVVLLWTTRGYTLVEVPNGVIIQMLEPTELAWYAQGRAATPEQIAASIVSGLPILREAAEKDGPEAVAELEARTAWVRAQVGMAA